MKPNAINYLSLARKAGRIEVGEEPTGACARAGHARLVLVAGDAPDNTVRRAKNFVEGTDQQMVVVPFTKDEMGAALGRTSVALAAMTDPSMALALLRALEDPKQYGKAIADLENRSKRAKQHREEEKAHERNLRTGKKRTEEKKPEEKKPEEKKFEERKSEDRRSAPRQDRPAAGRYDRRKDYEGPAGEHRPYRESDRPFGGKPAYGKRFDHKDSERKPTDRKPGEWKDRPERKDGQEHRPYKGKPFGAQKKPTGGTAAKALPKPSYRGQRQDRADVTRTPGRKFGRKTHGGAE